jgi:sugar lactone lactonase YvrE
MSSAGGTSLNGMVDVFASGIQMGESPRWHNGRFWMCDWLSGEVLVFDAAGGREVVARIDGLPFSIDWLPDGRMLATTTKGVMAASDLSTYDGGGHAWNEIVVDPSGRAYVNMPGSMPWEESRPGVVGLVTGDGTSRIVAEDVWFPNGMAVTPDGATLILAESHAHRLTAFTIAADGNLVDRRVWADLGAVAAPDGICLDAEGAVWYADVPNQRCVRVAEGGAVLQQVEADRGCFACMLGGDDGRTLYITANVWSGGGAGDGVVLTERVDVPHAGHP